MPRRKIDVKQLTAVRRLEDVRMMSSDEIAKLTGLDKGNVHGDIKWMLAELELVPVDIYGRDRSDSISNREFFDAFKIIPELKHEQFQVVTDGRGYIDYFLLDKALSIQLVAGYNAKFLRAIIERWLELEEKERSELTVAHQQLTEDYDQLQSDYVALQLEFENSRLVTLRYFCVEQRVYKIPSEKMKVIGANLSALAEQEGVRLGFVYKARMGGYINTYPLGFLKRHAKRFGLSR